MPIKEETVSRHLQAFIPRNEILLAGVEERPKKQG